MTRGDAAGWEELARREPYFPVLDHDGLATREAFFETGEADIAALLSAIAMRLGHDLPLTSTLDFGCGVGRLTIPLARRSKQVVACDIAPTMLVHARQNVLDAGLNNVTFIEPDALSSLEGRFDFVCSLLVLQYIPPAAGHAMIDVLLRALAPSGVAALHVTFERRGERLHRFARTVAGDRAVPREHAATAMNEYDKFAVHQQIASAGAQVIGRFVTHHGETAGAVLIIEK